MISLKLKKGQQSSYFEVKDDVDALAFHFQVSGYLQAMVYDPHGQLALSLYSHQDCDRLVGLGPERSDPACGASCFKGTWRVDSLAWEDSCLELGPGEERSIEPGWKPIGTFQEASKTSYWACDLHFHSRWSDGEMEIGELNQEAQAAGLDLISPADHNVLHAFWPGSIPSLPGMEITSSLGHANILFAGGTPFSDHSLFDLTTKTDFQNLLLNVHRYGLLSINHPFFEPCHFQLEDFPLNHIRFLEIINGVTNQFAPRANELALKAWKILLNDGYQIVGIGGSDTHLPPFHSYTCYTYIQRMGKPASWIWAPFTYKGLKQALEDGRVAVSWNGLLDLKGARPGDQVPPGKLTISLEGPTSYHYRGLHVAWVLDGEEVEESPLNQARSFQIGPGYHYLFAEVWDEDGKLFGFTNPVFTGQPPGSHHLKTWGDLLDRMGA